MKTATVPPGLLKDRAVSTLVMPQNVRAANLTDDRCFTYGINNELATSTPYKVSQQWAQCFQAEGFGGIWYRARFSVGENSRALALFDAAGEHPDYEHEGVQELLPLVRSMGIKVLDVSPGGFDIQDAPPA